MTDLQPTAGLEVRRSPVHGLGVFALRRFAPGEHIARYDGRRVPAEQAEGECWDTRLTYLFALSDGSMIDGAEGGNASRHINHSCAPNCVAFEVEDGGQLHIEIEARTPIAVGHELFLDYQLIAEPEHPDEFACRCASVTCRGTMLASPTSGD